MWALSVSKSWAALRLLPLQLRPARKHQLLVSKACESHGFSSTLQLPFKIPQIPSNRDYKALNRATLRGLGSLASLEVWIVRRFASLSIASEVEAAHILAASASGPAWRQPKSAARVMEKEDVCFS